MANTTYVNEYRCNGCNRHCSTRIYSDCPINDDAGKLAVICPINYDSGEFKVIKSDKESIREKDDARALTNWIV